MLEDIGLLHPRQQAPPSSPDGDLAFDWRVVEQVRPEIDDPDPEWSEVVAALAAPTLVIVGGSNSPMPQEHIAELVGMLPDRQQVTLDAGHLAKAVRESGPAVAEAYQVTDQGRVSRGGGGDTQICVQSDPRGRLRNTRERDMKPNHLAADDAVLQARSVGDRGDVPQARNPASSA